MGLDIHVLPFAHVMATLFTSQQFSQIALYYTAIRHNKIVIVVPYLATVMHARICVCPGSCVQSYSIQYTLKKMWQTTQTSTCLPDSNGILNHASVLKPRIQWLNNLLSQSTSKYDKICYKENNQLSET